ncbi:MAG: VTT domain-containing protein [Pseudomonadota bacterium]|nr:VTT domain-containing protein [Pseudomonadota bacterium]
MSGTLIDWILHLDTHLATLASGHGVLVYGILFAMIFIETGVVVMPFLPGDSLLFVCGALAAKGILAWQLVVPLLIVAAIAGDALNYALGDMMRKKAIEARRIPFIKTAHVERTQAFFDRHGRKTIILARFVPVVRTLAPFVAALGSMPYPVFLRYNAIGAVLWVAGLAGAGFALGNVAWVSANLTPVLLGLIGLSMLPGLIAWMRERQRTRTGPL